jgi:hypothetical protein
MDKANDTSQSTHAEQSPYRRLAESPFIWGAIGMIAGATISVLPMRDFFIAGWVLIGWGCVRELTKGRAALAALVVGATLAVFYHEVPKPPTTDQLAEAIAVRLVPRLSARHPQAPNPPTALSVTVGRRSEAEIVAEKVLELMKRTKQ